MRPPNAASLQSYGYKAAAPQPEKCTRTCLGPYTKVVGTYANRTAAAGFAGFITNYANCLSSANPDSRATFKVGGDCALQCDNKADYEYVHLIRVHGLYNDDPVVGGAVWCNATALSPNSGSRQGSCTIVARAYCCIPCFAPYGYGRSVSEPNVSASIASRGAPELR